MEIPSYYALYRPFLQAIRDGQTYSIKAVRENAAQMLALTEAELAERLPSNRQTVFANRLGWAKTYLLKAGMLTSPRRGYVQITEKGRELLSLKVPITNEVLAKRSVAFQEFWKHTAEEENDKQERSETPQETLDRMYKAINEKLTEDLLAEIMSQSPVFFEKLVVELMQAMGYGEGTATQYSGDGGIDGIIHEDRLGFNLIYIQAKRWSPDQTVGKPEIQKFAGAMMGPPKVERGLFITTAKFSAQAVEFAKAQHIILVDGRHLAELMIEYNLGVTTQKTYLIKRVDTDYFSEED